MEKKQAQLRDVVLAPMTVHDELVCRLMRLRLFKGVKK